MGQRKIPEVEVGQRRIPEVEVEVVPQMREVVVPQRPPPQLSLRIHKSFFLFCVSFVSLHCRNTYPLGNFR